jgi:hypothetical protein
MFSRTLDITFPSSRHVPYPGERARWGRAWEYGKSLPGWTKRPRESLGRRAQKVSWVDEYVFNIVVVRGFFFSHPVHVQLQRAGCKAFLATATATVTIFCSCHAILTRRL